MPAPEKSIRPKARSKTAVMKSVRPLVRPKTVDVSPKAEKGDQEHVKPMAKGGMTRGCGAATKGKRYSRSG